MSDTGGITRDWFIAATSALAALIGGYNVYLNNLASEKIERLKTQIAIVSAQRQFAATIMERYDKVVTDTSERPVRVSRLEGLYALAKLLQSTSENDESGLDTAAILTVISAQAEATKGELEEAARTAEGSEADLLSAQYRRVSNVAAGADAALVKIEQSARAQETEKDASTKPDVAQRPTATASAAIDRYRFDIFWCSGVEGSAEALTTANALRSLQSTTSQQQWRVKAISPETNQRPGYRISGNVIRVESGEEGVARNFARLASARGIDLGFQRAGSTRSAGILSVFVCPQTA